MLGTAVQPVPPPPTLETEAWAMQLIQEDSGPLGTQHGRIDVTTIVSIQMHEIDGANSATVKELERFGPKYLLSIKSVSYEQPIFVGAAQRGSAVRVTPDGDGAAARRRRQAHRRWRIGERSLLRFLTYESPRRLD